MYLFKLCYCCTCGWLDKRTLGSELCNNENCIIPDPDADDWYYTRCGISFINKEGSIQFNDMGDFWEMKEMLWCTYCNKTTKYCHNNVEYDKKKTSR